MDRLEARKLLGKMEANATHYAAVADEVLPWIDYCKTLVDRLEKAEARDDGLVAHFTSDGVMVWLDGEPLARERMSAPVFVSFLRERLGTSEFEAFANMEINRFSREFFPALVSLAARSPGSAEGDGR